MTATRSSFNPKERFSSRAEAYLKYRPHYPKEIIPHLTEAAGLTKEDVIADIGSGTGFLAELFLQNGNVVFGVEPNKEMRETGERYLIHYSNFRSITGSAESIPLREHSVTMITAGQAFHWFEPQSFQRECRRILKDKSIVCLIWNERDVNATKFLQEYEALVVEYAKDYKEIRHDNISQEELESFFGGENMHEAVFPYSQRLDFEDLKGRLLSSSYIPLRGEPKYDEMIGELEKLFNKNNEHSSVEIIYATKLYWGKIN